MEIIWTFFDGVQKHHCTSFPFAYRALHTALKKGVEYGKSSDSMTRIFKIISPFKKEYNYTKASALATEQGLLNSDGSLNSKEFKRKH